MWPRGVLGNIICSRRQNCHQKFQTCAEGRKYLKLGGCYAVRSSPRPASCVTALRPPVGEQKKQEEGCPPRVHQYAQDKLLLLRSSSGPLCVPACSCPDSFYRGFWRGVPLLYPVTTIPPSWLQLSLEMALWVNVRERKQQLSNWDCAISKIFPYELL